MSGGLIGRHADGVTVLDFATSGTGPSTLPDVVREHHHAVKAATLEHGAVLVRGGCPLTVDDFSRAASCLLDDVVRGNGEHEPANQDGDVQTPVPYDASKKLLWHNENSFNESWPLTLLFGARQPARTGGQTPLADSRRLLGLLDPALVSRFRERGVAYLRSFEPGAGRTWQSVFGTDSRSQVEVRCADRGIDFTWGPGDVLRTRAVRPAVVAHPLTGELSWFAQAQHWHPRCLDEETREAVLSIYAPDELPRDCRYGDGTAVPDSVLEEILQAYEEIEVSFDWAEGDLLVVDNVATAHARNPYEGPRSLLVAMGDEYAFAERTGTGVRKAEG